MYKVKVYVTLRESVLDPQGAAVQQSLNSLSYPEIEDVRIGKYMELSIQECGKDINQTVKEVCEKLLVNTVIEDYRYEIEEVVAQ
ncbi:MAG: phosphoribosylformylglycinamidine synthase subunit PurS [Bacillus sp. (in: firmicutes)]